MSSESSLSGSSYADFAIGKGSAQFHRLGSVEDAIAEDPQET